MQPSFILPILYCAEHLFLSIFQPVSRRRGRYRRRSFANIRLDCKCARGWKAIIHKENEGRNERYRENEREEKGKYFIFSLFLFLSLYIVLIFFVNAIQSGHTSFASHSFAYTFKLRRRRRRPSNLLCFSFCLFFFLCSFGRHRVIIWGSYPILVHVADDGAALLYQQRHISFYLYLYMYIKYTFASIILAFRFSHRFESSIYTNNLGLCCFVVVVFFFCLHNHATSSIATTANNASIVSNNLFFRRHTLILRKF